MATHTAPTSTASPLDAHRSPVAGSDSRSGKATVALTVGIVGLIAGAFIPLAGWILGIVAIVLGATARADIKRTTCRGGGQALAGLILGILAIVVATLAFTVFVSNNVS